MNLPWGEMFIPNHALEVVVRGTLAYLGILLLLKVVLKRQTGNLATNDLLVTVLIADAVQNGMAGEYKSITDGLLLVTTIVLWDYFLDWLSYRWAPLRNLLSPAPVLLVSSGKMLRRNMRKELVTEEELWAALRHEGVESLSGVKKAYLESEGEISVIKN